MTQNGRHWAYTYRQDYKTYIALSNGKTVGPVNYIGKISLFEKSARLVYSYMKTIKGPLIEETISLK